jgi:sarcosine oxidase subunit alpha
LLKATCRPEGAYDVAIVGGGPAGLCAALEASRSAASVALFDENPVLGGQLVKQTHKFFGAQEHYSGRRGFEIAELLRDEARASAVEVFTGTKIWSIDENQTLWVNKGELSGSIQAKAIILACGAKEKAVFFPGWTKPGVLYAGALQTLVNLWGVAPGERVLILGAGNVGLIIAYQLVQAGLRVAGIIEKRAGIGGFQVHANRVKRLGIPIFFNAELLEAGGLEQVEEATIGLGRERMTVKADVICIAAGMSPQVELLRAAGCDLRYDASLGGYLPKHDESLRVDERNIFVCGDMCGIEEASIAMEEGRLAALSALRRLSLGATAELEAGARGTVRRLQELRSGDK